jgi:hypothetical protein
MSTPLPLKIGHGRSLVDKTRIRWAGLGDIVLGLLFLAAEGFGTMVVGVLFVALGLATWVVTRFGNRSFTQLTPVWKVVVVVSSLGFLFLALFHVLWVIINKIVDSTTKKSTPS